MDLNRDQSYSQRDYNVSLDIQELVLIDVPASDRQGLQKTVTTELTRLLQNEGVPERLGQASQRAVVSSDITIDISNQSSEQLGAAIARAIYRGLDRGLGQ